MRNNEYTGWFNPDSYPSFFPNMTPPTDGNIVQGDKQPSDRTQACYWNDWGNDIFDSWGYFYLYDVETHTYYYPLLEPRDTDDGIINTQVVNAFGRTFTIKHGYPVQGIFKIDITVNDTKPFRFGGYGNMGYDSHGTIDHNEYNYSIGNTNLTLFYEHTQDNYNVQYEHFYLYFIPKKVVDNQLRTYEVNYDVDNMFIKSKEITNGLIVYFAKSNDVKDWVINDLKITM